MKRLIVCCDGTWQDLKADYPTNVVKLVQAITNQGEDQVPQVVFYDEGIGTRGKWDKITGGALGKGIDQNILDGYRFLILNYEPGDEIYLFGFSRGSYTVRSLAGLIYCSGLPKREFIRCSNEAYDIYRDRKIHPDDAVAGDFRNKYCGYVDIALLACWDTVGALGVPDWVVFDRRFNEKYRFHDMKLDPRIRYALHAVSIDERRKVFNVTCMMRNTDAPAQQQTLKEVWFAGDHGSIGGGDSQKAGLSDITLQWMIDKIKEYGLGLSFDTGRIEGGIRPDHTLAFDGQLNLIERALYRSLYRDVTEEFDSIHQTVKQRWRDRADYRPKNLAEKFGSELDRWSETNRGS